MRPMPYLPMIGVAFYVICWITAAMMMPEWRFMQVWPSTLGTAASPGQLIFNTGMVVSGALMAVYGYSMHTVSENIWLRLSFILASVGGALLMGVGIFNDDIAYMHELFTMSMFTISMISIIYLGAYFISTGRKNIAVVLLLSVFAVCISGPLISNPAWDTIGTIFIDVWSFTVSFAAWRYPFWKNDGGRCSS
jgi:hypothetical membrane protein